MINLLPNKTKQEIRAARMNVLLLQYNVFTILSLLALVGLYFAFFLFLNVSQESAIATSDKNEAKAKDLISIQKEADEYKENLSTAKKIFEKSTNYTNVVIAITKLVPAGVLLDAITVKDSDIGTPVQFSAHAASAEKAALLKESFQNSELFSNVFLQNISNANESSSTGYPVTFTISAQMNKVAGIW